MPRAKKINDVITKVAEDEVLSMPLITYDEYMKYNARARAENKKFRYCKYTIKPCPEELHEKQRVIFSRNDQPRNPLPVYLRNEKIEYKKTLTPGKAYDLPLCVIDHLSKRGTAIWKWFDNPDGSRETRKSGMEPRFSLRTSYAE